MLNYCFGHKVPRVELAIGRPDKEQNKKAFDQLYRAKDEIESVFGGPLGWERMDDNKTSRIQAPLPSGSVRDETSWPQLQDQMIELMVRFEKALRPHIDKLEF